MRKTDDSRDTDYEPAQDDAPQHARHWLALIGAAAFIGLVVAVLALHGWS